MAAIASVVVTSFYSETLRAIRKSNPFQLLFKALQGGSVENQLAARMVADQNGPDFVITGTTDTNTAASPAIELVANGVTFPDGAHRYVTVRATVADDDGVGVVEAKAIIDGGTTPIVVADLVDADTIAGGVATAPTLTIVAGASTLTINAVGASADNLRWNIEVRIGDLVPLPYLA